MRVINPLGNRGDWIRTSDLLNPMQEVAQTRMLGPWTQRINRKGLGVSMSESRTVASSVRTFLLWAAKKMRAPTVAYYRHFLERFAESYGELELSAVTRLDVEMWADLHHPLQAVSRFFKWAVDVAQYLQASPCRSLKLPGVGRRRRTLDRRERVTIRRLAGRALRDALLCLESSGCRPGEMRAVRWEDIHVLGGRNWNREDLAEGRCYFVLAEYKCQDRRAHPDTPRLIPINRRLGKLLGRLSARSVTPRGPIFAMACGRPWTPNGFRCAFRRLRAKLGELGHVDADGLVPYLLRHTKATELCRAGRNSRLVADYLGHVGLEMLSVYVHPSIADLMELDRNDGERDPAAG